MAGETPEKPPELARLEAILQHCARRVGRSNQRVATALAEQHAAAAELRRAGQAVEAWQAANPDPQRALFDGESN